VNAIIRLSCIDRYNGFIYRRGSESSGGTGTGTRVCEEEQEQVPEFVRRNRGRYRSLRGGTGTMNSDRIEIRKGRA